MSSDKIFYNLMPQFYQVFDDNKMLQDFLQAFEEVKDEIKADIKKFVDLIDVDKVEYELLPQLAYLLGIEFDYKIPEDVARNEIKNAAEFYKIKGTLDGVKSYVRLASGLQNRVTVDKDLMKLTIVIMLEKEREIQQYQFDRIVRNKTKFIPIIWDVDFFEEFGIYELEDLSSQMLTRLGFSFKNSDFLKRSIEVKFNEKVIVKELISRKVELVEKLELRSNFEVSFCLDSDVLDQVELYDGNKQGDMVKMFSTKNGVIQKFKDFDSKIAL